MLRRVVQHWEILAFAASGLFVAWYLWGSAGAELGEVDQQLLKNGLHEALQEESGGEPPVADRLRQRCTASAGSMLAIGAPETASIKWFWETSRARALITIVDRDDRCELEASFRYRWGCDESKLRRVRGELVGSCRVAEVSDLRVDSR